MLSRMVPPNSQVSCSTMPIRERSSCRDIAATSTPSSVTPGVELIEAHHQVHQPGLPRTGGPQRPGDGAPWLSGRVAGTIT